MSEAVIVAATRSPLGLASKGSLKSIRPDDLASSTVQAALDRVPQLTPGAIDDLFLGCSQQVGDQSQHLGRVVALLLGRDNLPAATVDRFCASSMLTTAMAYHAIKAGEGDAFISAGVESPSRYRVADQRRGLNPRFAAAARRVLELAKTHQPWQDPREQGLLPDAYIAMGQTAENIATYRGVSRAEQDDYAVLSQARAQKAIIDGVFEREISPITLADGTVVSRDDGPRAGVTSDQLALLPSIVRPEGTVTEGNSFPLADGSAALVVMSADRAKALGIEPLARIVSTATSALSPEVMGLSGVDASRLALDRAGLSIDQIDLVELSESFAAQVIPTYRDLGIDPAKLNVAGGSLALGHPFGANGARMTTTLLSNLATADKRYGLQTVAAGGGQGMAMVLERLS